ncbi:MAG: sugar phosphate nucleotidyltransferase [Patescibacteria group bacterium]
MFEDFGIIILAAGQGKRLGCTDKPKVLLEIGGWPMVSYILETLEKGGVPKENICLVVGLQAEKVKEKLGPGYIYAMQEEQLGTAHAAHTGEEALRENVKNFLVLNGDDSAFLKFETLEKFVSFHLDSKNDLTLLTCEVGDPSLLGRVARDKIGKLRAVIEKENLTAGVADTNEVSSGIYCFKREWFRNVFPDLKPILNLNEYGLPSFIDEAAKLKAKFDAMAMDNPSEWFGINTPEQLKEADRRKTEIAKI